MLSKECQQPTLAKYCNVATSRYSSITLDGRSADHGAFDFKNALFAYVQGELKMEVEDCGAVTLDPADDYPVIICRCREKALRGLARGHR